MSKNDYLRQIHQLVELQKVDDEIFAVRQRMENAPRELNELERRFAVVEGRRNHILDKLSHLQEQKKRLSLEIDDDSAKIKKSKNKLMQVTNEREHQAMLREIDNMDKSNRSREEEKMTLLEELDTQNANLEEIDREYNALKADVDNRRASLDETLAADQAELDKLQKKRREASEFIPAPIFMRYEFIRNRLEHPVIVAAEDGICSGCHIAIPPQTFIELQMGQQILSCPNCQRLIFWSQHFEQPQRAERRQEEKPAPEEAEEEL